MEGEANRDASFQGVKIQLSVYEPWRVLWFLRSLWMPAPLWHKK